MTRVQIVVDGTRYDLDEESGQELLEFIGATGSVSKKPRFQFAQKVLAKSIPAMRTGANFLASSLAISQTHPEHAHEDHRVPHYEDSFERSKDAQKLKEDEYIDRFGEGIDRMYEKLEREESNHDTYNDYLEHHLENMYASRRLKKKLKKFRGEE